MNLDKEITTISVGSITQNRLTMTPPPPASRKANGGATAYMPRNLACWQWSAKESKEAGGREAEERNEAEEREV